MSRFPITTFTGIYARALESKRCMRARFSLACVSVRMRPPPKVKRQ